MNTIYSLGLYEKGMPETLDIPEKLKYAKKAGYDFIEMSIDETDEKLARLDWCNDEIKKILDAQKENNIAISSFCLSGHRRFPLGHPDHIIRSQSLEIMKKSINLAVNLGVRIIQIAGYDVYYEESNSLTRLYFKENLYKSVEFAAKHGVILAFENMETEFLNTVEKAMFWVDGIESPYLQIYPDTGNMTNAGKIYGIDAVSDFETGRGHIVALHLKESRPNVYREVPYGEGHVDFERIISAALHFGVRMFLAEFWHLGETNWFDIIKRNGQFLRSIIEHNLSHSYNYERN